MCIRDSPNAAFAAKEHRALVISGKAAYLLGPAEPAIGLGGDLVEVFHIHGVEAFVKGDGLHIHIGPKQFGPFDLDTGSRIQNGLGAAGGINPQILQTFFITAMCIL